MTQVRHCAEERLRGAAESNLLGLYAGGVGGWRLLAQVGSDGPVEVVGGHRHDGYLEKRVQAFSRFKRPPLATLDREPG